MRWLLALLVVGMAGAAHAQPTCTLGPFTSSTPIGTIDAAVDGAANGAVVCLRRGNNWPGGISLSTNHPDASRVTICSSDDTQCTTGAGGANARLTPTSGQCWSHGDSSAGDGYTFSNIDCYAGGGQCNSLTPPVFLRKGTDNVWFDGGVYDGWPHMVEMYNVPEAPDNIDFGSCANRIEYRNCIRALAPRALVYGVCRNCTMSFYVHDWGHQPFDQGKGHGIDLNPWSGGEGTSTNTIVQCSLIQLHGLQVNGMGSWVKAADASGLIVQDNVIEDLDRFLGSNQLRGVDLEGHSDQIPCFVDGATIRRNTFKLSNGASQACFRNKLGRNVRFENNVCDMDGTFPSNFFGGAVVVQGEGAGCFAQWAPDNTWLYNNTFRTAVNPQQNTVSFTAGTGHRVANNLIINRNTDAWQQGAIPFQGTCASFGTNGVGIKSNWVYTPNDSTPTITDCSAATPDFGGSTVNGFRPGSGFHTATAIPGVTNESTGDFTITTASNVYQQGTTDSGDAPTTDYTGGTRPSPPSVGAYDVVGAPPADSVVVEAPNGGESYGNGTTQDIFWSAVGAWANAHIELSTTGCAGAFSDIIASTPNDGVYAWTVPATATVSACVRISDVLVPATTDTSDAVFTIVVAPTPDFVITSPNGGEELARDAATNITWGFVGTPTPANVRIRSSTTGCAGAWTVVSASTANDGVFSWTPTVNTTQGCIEVSDAADNDPIDTSDAVFTVEDPPAPPVVTTSCDGTPL